MLVPSGSLPGDQFGWSVSVSGLLLLVDNLLNAFPVQLLGTQAAPGAGTLTFPVGIPNSPGLVGTGLNLQVALFDPGAILGVSLTNGAELIIEQ